LIPQEAAISMIFARFHHNMRGSGISDATAAGWRTKSAKMRVQAGE